MLSGRSPFYSRTRTDSASHVMRRIKEGDFRLEGEPWRYVSSQAKSLTKGLLTVDPRKRVSMDQLRNNNWIGAQGQTHHLGAGALLTTSILSTEPLERCLKQTYDAFHNVTREGFRLTPVSSASSKLAQKRKMKQSLSSDTSSLSDRSSLGSKGSSTSSVTLTPTKHWAEAAAAAASNSRPLSKEPSGVEIFSFKPGHVAQYLTTSPQQPFPSSLMTPLSVNVTATPAPTFPSSHSAAHAQYIQSFSTPTVAASSGSAFAPFSDTVSLGLIRSNLNVINSTSSSVIQRVGHGFLTSAAAAGDSKTSPSAYQHTVTVSSQASGPLTRSRKRRMFEGDNGEKTIEKHFGKTKVQRAGTIVIE